MVKNSKVVMPEVGDNFYAEGMTQFTSERGTFFDRFGGARVFKGVFTGSRDVKDDDKNENAKSPVYGKKLKRIFKVLLDTGETINFDDRVSDLIDVFTHPNLKPGRKVLFEYKGCMTPKTKVLHTEPLDKKAALKVFPRAAGKKKARGYQVWGKILADVRK